jgi:predicted nucleic acid-binding protein
LSLLVDTSVWSLFLRRDRPANVPEVDALIHALETGDRILCTGLILQELLQGFSGPKARRQIIERYAAFPLLNPDREDHIAAAELRNLCRARGVQAGTIDALLAQLCIRYELTILTTDVDFEHIAKHTSLQIWAPRMAKILRYATAKRHLRIPMTQP